MKKDKVSFHKVSEGVVYFTKGEDYYYERMAVKDHECTHCKNKIKKGTRYFCINTTIYKHRNNYITSKYHKECFKQIDEDTYKLYDKLTMSKELLK